MTSINIPTVETERLILRAPTLADFEAHLETLASDRAIHIDGPYTRGGAWRDFAADCGSWVLRGHGAWSLELKSTGDFAGIVILHRPANYPENELGWVLHADAEGKGIAFEAATAARDYAYEALGWTTLVSYIDPGNVRSIALAERLGARRDENPPLPEASNPDVEVDCLVYRHPGPEAVQ